MKIIPAPDAGKLIAELKAAGWKCHATIPSIWISPWGAWYQGLYNAWKNIEFESNVSEGKECPRQ